MRYTATTERSQAAWHLHMKLKTESLTSKEPLIRFGVVDQLRGLLVAFSAVAILLPVALDEWGDRSRWNWLIVQLQPSIWHGCTLFDLVKAGFLFVSGVSTSLSVSRRREQGQASISILTHLARQCGGLFLLGIVIDSGILNLQWPLRYCGCFQQIAICKFGSGAIELLTGRKTALLFACIGLINYGTMIELEMNEDKPSVIPRQNVADPTYTDLAVQIDQRFLPGRKYFGSWDPQGLLVTLPALAIALFGVTSASLIHDPSIPRNWMEAWGKPAFLGLALIQGGSVLSRWQPLNMSLLTPPFALVIVGACLLGIGVLALIQRFKVARAGLDVLGHLGQKCLALMIMLHLVDYFAFAFLVKISDRVGLPTSHGHTVLALLTLVGMVLCCRRIPIAFPSNITDRSSDQATIPSV